MLPSESALITRHGLRGLEEGDKWAAVDCLSSDRVGEKDDDRRTDNGDCCFLFTVNQFL
jgi:hypothetical protein